MEEMLDNNTYFRMLYKIASYENDRFTLTKLCEDLDINRSHPYFTEIISFLKTNGFLVEDIKLNSQNILYKLLKRKSLYLYLRRFQDFSIAGKIIEKTTVGYIY